MGHGFNDENGEHHGVDVIDVDHEAGDQCEEQPLRQGARRAGFMPIPEEESDGESGMRVGPGWIEIHIDGERAGPPNGDGGEEGPAFFDILARETEGEEQAEKTIDSGGEGHGDAVGSGETVGGNGRTEDAREKDAGMCDEETRRPENRGSDGEVVVEVTGARSKEGPWLVIFVKARAAEAFVGMAVVFSEIQIVLDERGAGKGVITDAIAADPGIEKWERTKKEKKKQALRIRRALKRRWAEVLLIHEGGSRRKLLLSPAPSVQQSSTMWSQTPKPRKGPGNCKQP